MDKTRALNAQMRLGNCLQALQSLHYVLVKMTVVRGHFRADESLKKAQIVFYFLMLIKKNIFSKRN